jgi:hypothetical protein
MRPKRILTRDAWYEVRTAVNNRKSLFRRWRSSTGRSARHGRRFAFEVHGFRLEEEQLSFYIRPADGLQLPAIMQWLKQTFAVRFNLRAGRTGHIWGDWYWSRVLEGVGEVDWDAVEVAAETGTLATGKASSTGVSPLAAENPAEIRFSPQNPARSLPPSG